MKAKKTTSSSPKTEKPTLPSKQSQEQCRPRDFKAVISAVKSTAKRYAQQLSVADFKMPRLRLLFQSIQRPSVKSLSNCGHYLNRKWAYGTSRRHVCTAFREEECLCCEKCQLQKTEPETQYGLQLLTTECGHISSEAVGSRFAV